MKLNSKVEKSFKIEPSRRGVNVQKVQKLQCHGGERHSSRSAGSARVWLAMILVLCKLQMCDAVGGVQCLCSLQCVHLLPIGTPNFGGTGVSRRAIARLAKKDRPHGSLSLDL